MIETIGNAQMQYEDEEWDKIQEALGLQEQGHAPLCAAKQVWCNAKCSCFPGDFLANREEG